MSGGSRWLSVLAIDPGGDTGWKWGLVDASLEPTAAVQAARDDGRLLGGTIGGNENGQVQTIERFWSSACQRADRLVRGLGGLVDEYHLVTEGFILGILDSDPSLLSPVRILAKLDLMVDEKRLQPEPDDWSEYLASQAKSTVTDDRLRRWGLWTKGSAHERDAQRHMILHLRSIA